MTRVLVSGGAGFIGSHVAEAYRRLGHEVLAVDNLSGGRRENLPPDIPLEVADITDAGRMEGIFREFRPELVNHHAAQINVRHSVDDPAFDAKVNILGLINLAGLAVRHGVSKFVFSSSGGAIYGEQRDYPATEDHPTNPLSPYGVSKLAGEHYLFYYKSVWGLRPVILRYANVYGPRQDPRGEAGVVAIFFSRIIEGRQPVINGDGLQTRDYIYVADVAAANMAVSEGSLEGTFNVGTGGEVCVNELFARVCGVAGADLREEHGPEMKGEQRRSSVDPARLASATGWKPSVDLSEGLRRTYYFFRGGRGGR